MYLTTSCLHVHRLIDHPVIRLKLANMARQLESSWSMLESVTYQMSTLSKAEQNQVLSGPIALLVWHNCVHTEA